MLGVLRVKPQRSDLHAISELCYEKGWKFKKNTDGTIDFDYEELNVPRTEIIDAIRKVADIELGVAAMAESKFDLLKELLQLTEEKNKTEKDQLESGADDTNDLSNQ